MKRIPIALSTIVLAAFAMLLPGPASAGAGCHERPMTDEATDIVVLEETCFTPFVARIDAGASVTFVNRSVTEHTVGGVGGTWGDAYGKVLSNGERVRYRFDGEGVFPYFCMLHPGMIGAVVVGDGMGDGAVAGSVQAAPLAGGDTAPAPAETEDGFPFALAIPAAVGAGALLGVLLGYRLRRERRGDVAPAPSA